MCAPECSLGFGFANWKVKIKIVEVVHTVLKLNIILFLPQRVYFSVHMFIKFTHTKHGGRVALIHVYNFIDCLFRDPPPIEGLPREVESTEFFNDVEIKFRTK
jgi:hypothetical protein